MKKTVLAVTLVALPLAAMADVTLYGKVKMAVETSMVQYGDEDVTRTNIDDVGSRIGFKGTEALSSNLNAIWQVETALSMTGSRDGNGVATGSSFGKLRDSFVGLQSNDFGTLQIGRLGNFANIHQGVADFWTYGQKPLGLAIFTNNGTRYDHAVRYTTPELSGLTAFVQYGQAEHLAGKVITDTSGWYTDQADSSINAGLKFASGPWQLTYGYEDNGSSYTAVQNIAPYDVVDHSVEGVYQSNGLLLALGYRNTALTEDGKNILPYSSDVDTEQYAFSVAYEMGAWKPKFSYAYAKQKGYLTTADVTKQGTLDFDVESAESKTDQYILGFDYGLSKRTVIGSQFGYIKEHSSDAVQSLGVNVVHSF